MSNLTTPTVLIADDDPDCRAIVQSAVSILGFTPVEASDGAAAIELLDRGEIDLAILDIMMPHASGNEVCQHLKASDHGKMVPVLMLTARDGLQDKVKSLEQGADDYLTKPFHFDELQARIKALLRVRELTVRLHQQHEELKAMQDLLVTRERQLLATQLGGTAAHSLGQPLSAILLNCHLINLLPASDPRHGQALAAVKLDAERMAHLLEKLKSVDAQQTTSYFGAAAILELEPPTTKGPEPQTGGATATSEKTARKVQ